MSMIRVVLDANVLVSGNTGHFEEAGGIYQGVQILSPRQFLDLLNIAGE